MIVRGNGLPVLAVGLYLSCASLAAAGDAVYVGSKDGHLVSIDKIDHTGWSNLLARYVAADGMVDYRSWKQSSEDRDGLNQYLVDLSAADPNEPASQAARLSFWINAYNAVTIQGILREYPTSSIRNHTARFFGYNIWKDFQLYVGGTPYSLEAIEHQVLRKLGDPRIHFGIVCASLGCPRLLDQAYLPARVDEQLEANAIDFFARRQNFQYDPRGNVFRLSSILKWYDKDFGATDKQVLETIAKWLPTAQARQAALRGGAISYLSYDWNLNEQK